MCDVNESIHVVSGLETESTSNHASSESSKSSKKDMSMAKEKEINDAISKSEMQREIFKLEVFQLQKELLSVQLQYYKCKLQNMKIN